MTQLQLAKAAGYTERLVRKAEKGGRLDISTVQNLAEALSQFGEPVTVDSLLQDNLAIVKLWMEAFNELGSSMLASIEPYLSDDFVFDCLGDPQTAPFAGTYAGAIGLQSWLYRYFSVFIRQTPQALEFATGPDTVMARWVEICSIGDTPCEPIRTALYFRFRDGLIIRTDNDYDTKACEDAIVKAMTQQGEQTKITRRLDIPLRLLCELLLPDSGCSGSSVNRSLVDGIVDSHGAGFHAERQGLSMEGSILSRRAAR